MMFTFFRMEKEEIEEKKVDITTMWKTTAIVAAALIAGLHVLSGRIGSGITYAE